jgi:hypothetical protein
LRDHLFETLEALKDPDNPMELDRAKAISEVAQTIINAARVEVDLVKAMNASAPGSASFFNLPEEHGDLAKLPPGNERWRNPRMLRTREG